MKVKCDEAKPTCLRCERAGRRCPGYQDATEVIFRSMNKNAEQRSRRQTLRSRDRRSKSKRSGKGSDSDPVSESSTPDNILKRTPSGGYVGFIGAFMPHDWNHQAICYFFHNFVLYATPDGRSGYLEFLPDLYQERNDKAYFVEALTAVALASFANQRSMDQLMYRARRSYGRALSLMKDTLNNTDESKSDTAVTTLYLLTEYEIISGNSSLWETHHAGQRELIRLRGRDQLKTRRGCALYRLIAGRQRMQELRNYRQETILSPEPKFNSFYPTTHGAKLAEILTEASRLKCAVEKPEEAADYGMWVDDALTLDRSMQKWSDEAPEKWRYQQVPHNILLPGQDGKDLRQYPQEVWVFDSIQAGAARNIFALGRIYLLQSMLKYIQKLPTGASMTCPLPSEWSLRQRLIEIVNNVCSTVPFMLGEVDSQGSLNINSKTKAIGAYYREFTIFHTL